MRAPKSKVTTAAAVLAVFLLGLSASAATEDNTVVNLGYDENSHFFFWNVTSLEYEPWLDALETNEDFTEADLETLLGMCGLAHVEGDPTALEYAYDGETLSVLDTNGVPIHSGECGEFVGADVTGPAGQVNHGMFMKTFNSLFEGEHRGCVARIVAQSQLGKGDQQVRPGDADESEVEPNGDDTFGGTALFTTETTKCKVDTEDGEEAERRGPPAHVLEKFNADHPKNRESKGKPPGTPGGRP